MVKATISTIMVRASAKLGGYFEKPKIDVEDELVEETVVTCDTLVELISMLSATIDEFNVKTREFVFRDAESGGVFTVNDVQGESFYEQPHSNKYIVIVGTIDDMTNVEVKAVLWRHKS